MHLRYYLRNFTYSAIFWGIVISFFYFTDSKQFHFFPQLISYGLVSTLFYPFSYQFVEQHLPVLVKPAHWERWVGFITLSLAIPLGVIQLLIALFSAKR